MPIPPTANPLLQSYQQLLNPAFLELQRQLIAQQTAQFRFPLLPPTQLPSSMSLPSLRQTLFFKAFTSNWISFRPSTSEDLETLTSTPTRSTKSPEFEMGRLPTKNYIPSHFMKGTMIQMASGKLKKVEEMSSDDFLLAAPLTGEFNVDASVVVEIAKASTLARIKFSVGQLQYEIEYRASSRLRQCLWREKNGYFAGAPFTLDGKKSTSAQAVCT
ncbi:Ataxin-1 and HBP1 module [Dictyocaulus viviparus]|uniref:Ataxin-1 and HBP1 module n=1 Tax=Dictyocaulus viviparus TaxID=29172 RepID=A0A0D8YAP3_DICVI|nr:Ataxin-1 and HBP1 module [Dictyocaulus viviparus]